MKNVRLKALHMRNFRSFVDPTTVHFPRNGLILLQGLNGAGKSSVGLALAYALGFCPYSVKELTSWQANECDCDEDTQSMQVILELETEQGPVTLARGAKTYLRTESKEITGATAINKALQEITGLTPDLLSALTYRPQQTRGTFLSKTDGEKKEFLSILLGLNAIEEGIELTNGKISKLQAQAESLSPLVQAGKARLPQSIKEPEVIDCQPLSLLLHIVEEKLQKKANEVTAKGAEIKKAKEEMQALVATAVAPYEPMLAEINKQIKGLPSLSDISNKMEALRAKHRKYEMCQHEVKQGNDVLATKCEALKQQICYACGQAWANAQDELVRLATVQTELMKKNKPYIDMLPELEKRIAAAKEEFQQATINLEQLLNRKSEIQEERDQLVTKVQSTISRRIDDMQAEADKLNSDWRSLLSEGKQAESKLQNAERHNDSERRLWQQTMQQHSEAHLQQLKLEEQFATVQKELAQERDYALLLKGFLGAIFDEVLQEISSETNTVLGALQNTRHVTLNFRSETLTAKGTVKREIKPTVTISGYEAPIKSGCSGGMYLSVEQAVDLAIATVVTRRTGAIPGWLVLDECFGDQDLRTKESCMEVLKQFAANRQVLVVDHATEFKESFNQFINIEYDHGTGKSTIASVG